MGLSGVGDDFCANSLIHQVAMLGDSWNFGSGFSLESEG